jgi:hypothetical protein
VSAAVVAFMAIWKKPDGFVQEFISKLEVGEALVWAPEGLRKDVLLALNEKPLNCEVCMTVWVSMLMTGIVSENIGAASLDAMLLVIAILLIFMGVVIRSSSKFKFAALVLLGSVIALVVPFLLLLSLLVCSLASSGIVFILKSNGIVG